MCLCCARDEIVEFVVDIFEKEWHFGEMLRDVCWCCFIDGIYSIDVCLKKNDIFVVELKFGKEFKVIEFMADICHNR